MLRQIILRAKSKLLLLPIVLFSSQSTLPLEAHPTDNTVVEQALEFYQSFPASQQSRVQYELSDPARLSFNYFPGVRKGIPLLDLNETQSHLLSTLLQMVLSEKGALTVDKIIATEAALAVIDNAPQFRHPQKYYTAIFGAPKKDALWALRFEGHHLSINLTFMGEEMVSATPLFLGANPETVPNGPDSGLRALADQVDLGFEFINSLSESQQKTASGTKEWFNGFLNTPGTRRAKIGKPSGIAVANLSAAQQEIVKKLIQSYVLNSMPGFAAAYFDSMMQSEQEHLYVYWRGAKRKEDGNYYYRIVGKRLLIEHQNFAGGTHIHSVWRDTKNDFGDEYTNQ